MTEVREYLFSIKDELPVRLDIVVKSTPSSMHSFYEVARLLDGHGRFIATTVDTIFHENDFSRYVEAYSSAAEDVDGMMALTRFVDDEKPLYVEVGNDGFIKAFLDKATPEAEFVSGGIYGLNSSAVKVLDGCMERGVSRMRNFQRELIAAGLRIKGYDMGKIIDVDHAGDIRKAEEFIK
ncbi:MAG: NDP-sugar synthase [Muribaculaceae bacterium]|nr:NDP-sugar synthase [Muribaculaceae bacterium]